MAKVLVTVPNMHWIHKSVAATLLKLDRDNRGHQLGFEFPTNRPFENTLHHIVMDFVKSPYEFWLLINDDNPPKQNPLELIDLNLDIIGLPTPIWYYQGKPGERPIYWNAYRYVPDKDAYREWLPRDGLQEVDAVGTGCVLFHRRVFENKFMQRGAFRRTTDKNGRVIKGNDLAFCERARKHGFKVWCHFNYPCDHRVKELELNSVAKAIMSIAESPDMKSNHG